VLIAALHLDDPDGSCAPTPRARWGARSRGAGPRYLLQALDDPAYEVVVNAIRALQLVADTHCGTVHAVLTETLRTQSLRARHRRARARPTASAWRAPTAHARRAGLDSLTVRLRDPDAATRGAAARALLARRGAAALPAVEALLATVDLHPHRRALGARAGAARGREPILLEAARRRARRCSSA
jgi:hypothetical protein